MELRSHPKPVDRRIPRPVDERDDDILENGARIVVARTMRARGLNPTLVAADARIARSTFSAWLHGHRGMSAGRLLSVFRALQIEIRPWRADA